MATRRRSSVFTAPQEEEETKSIEEFLDANAREMFETLSQVESEVVEQTPFVEQKITPTDDVGPRFIEETIQAPAKPVVTADAPRPQPPPKRHPRNIPKFSRYK